MSKLNERASYLKGMADGMKLTADTDSNKLMLELLNLVGDIAAKLDELSDAESEIEE